MDFQVTITDGDLEKARKALAGVGAIKLRRPPSGREAEELGEGKRLVVLLDAEDEDDAEGLVTAVLPPKCQIAKIEEL